MDVRCEVRGCTNVHDINEMYEVDQFSPSGIHETLMICPECMDIRNSIKSPLDILFEGADAFVAESNKKSKKE